MDESRFMNFEIDIQDLKKFAGGNNFRRAATMVIAAHCTEKEIGALKTKFTEFDRDHNGKLSFEEFKKGFEECDIHCENL